MALQANHHKLLRLAGDGQLHRPHAAAGGGRGQPARDGANAQVPDLLRLLPGEAVLGAAGVSPEGCVLLASRCSQLKRLAVASLHRCQRGDKLIDLREDRSPVVAAELQAEDDTGSELAMDIAGSEAMAELVPLLGFHN